MGHPVYNGGGGGGGQRESSAYFLCNSRSFHTQMPF